VSTGTYAEGIEAICHRDALGINDTAATTTAAAFEAAATAAADKQHVKRTGTLHAEHGIAGDCAYLVLVHGARTNAAGDDFNVKFLIGSNQQSACGTFA
jgi:hypothetical protein